MASIALWYGLGSPAPITYTHFPKTFTQRPKDSTARDCTGRPGLDGSASYRARVLWHKWLDHISAVRRGRGTDGGQGQERDDHRRTHGRRGETAEDDETETTAPLMKPQRKSIYL